MNVWVGTSGGNKLVTDPWFGDATGVRRQAQQIWVGTATGNKLVYTRQQLAVTGVATSWSTIALTITPPGIGADIYTIKRNNVVIYNGAIVASYNDTGLAARGTYVYDISAQKAGQQVATAMTGQIITPARGTVQKDVILGRREYQSYYGSGSRRTNTSDMYSGYYSSNNGNQRCLALFDIPADVRGCVSIDAIYLSAWNIHAYNNSGVTKQCVITHHSTLASGTYGSTATFFTTKAGKPGWVSGGEWFEVKNYQCPGRTSVAEEFRTNGATGFGFGPGPDNSQSYYGYARNDFRMRFIYTVLA